MPKIFNVGDTIKIEGNFTNNPTMISYYYHSSGVNSEYNSDIIWRAWYNIGYKYIVLRQRKETVNKLAWIKLEVTGSSVIVLNSC